MCQKITDDLVEKIESRIKSHLPSAKFKLDCKDGVHMQLEVSSPDFKELSLVEQHRLVNRALKDLLNSGELHSIKLKTITI